MLYECGRVEVQPDTDYGGEDEEAGVGSEEGEVEGGGWAVLYVKRGWSPRGKG